VVWQKHDTSRGNQVYLYEIHGGNPPGGRKISNNDSVDYYAPQIAAGMVVWTSQRVAQSFEPGQIMLYDARNLSGPELISDSHLDCGAPRIDSKAVVWTQSDVNGTARLYTYDLTSESPQPKPAAQGFVWEDTSQTDGNLTVLTAYDGTDREVFIYDASLKSYEQITDNGLEDRYPRISGDKIAWVGGEGEASEIYLIAEFDNEPPEPEPPEPESGGGGGGGSCFVATAARGETSNSMAHIFILSLIVTLFAALFLQKKPQRASESFLAKASR
jgi:hypothetical protein